MPREGETKAEPSGLAFGKNKKAPRADPDHALACRAARAGQQDREQRTGRGRGADTVVSTPQLSLNKLGREFLLADAAGVKKKQKALRTGYAARPPAGILARRSGRQLIPW